MTKEFKEAWIAELKKTLDTPTEHESKHLNGTIIDHWAETILDLYTKEPWKSKIKENKEIFSVADHVDDFRSLTDLSQNGTSLEILEFIKSHFN